MSAAMKLVVNSAYGYLAASGLTRFADIHAANELSRDHHAAAACTVHQQAAKQIGAASVGAGPSANTLEVFAGYLSALRRRTAITNWAGSADGDSAFFPALAEAFASGPYRPNKGRAGGGY